MRQFWLENFGDDLYVSLVKAPLDLGGKFAPLLSDVTLANFDGYAPVHLPFFSQLIPFLSNGDFVYFDMAAWVLGADPAVGNDIFGYVLSLGLLGGDQLFAWESLAASKPMKHAGDAIVLDVPWSYPGAQFSAKVLS